MKDSHTSIAIESVIDVIQEEFDITKLVICETPKSDLSTDSGSNFLKAFDEFGPATIEASIALVECRETMNEKLETMGKK